MALALEQVEEFLWSDKRKTKCVRSKLSLVNESSESIRVEHLYIYNNISNYQELNSNESFAFHFKPILIQNSLDIPGISNQGFHNYEIDYPNYYFYQPGNRKYISDYHFPVISNRDRYNFIWSFDLHANSSFNFDIQFSPKEYNIDFYSARLFLKYTVEGVNFTKSWPLSASLIPNISEIDHTSFPDEVFSIQGMNPYTILTGS